MGFRGSKGVKGDRGKGNTVYNNQFIFKIDSTDAVTPDVSFNNLLALSDKLLLQFQSFNDLLANNIDDDRSNALLATSLASLVIDDDDGDESDDITLVKLKKNEPKY